MKTRDKYEVKEGMWIEDTNGIYEVEKIYPDNTARVKEIVFPDDNDPDKWEYGDTLDRNKYEIGNCYYL